MMNGDVKEFPNACVEDYQYISWFIFKNSDEQSVLYYVVNIFCFTSSKSESTWRAKLFGYIRAIAFALQQNPHMAYSRRLDPENHTRDLKYLDGISLSIVFLWSCRLIVIFTYRTDSLGRVNNVKSGAKLSIVNQAH